MSVRNGYNASRATLRSIVVVYSCSDYDLKN